MQVFEGSTLTFDVPEIYRTMNYFPVIRYIHDPSHPIDWELVTVELVRYDGAPGDKCSDDDNLQNVRLPAGELNAQADAPFCLEKSQRYQIKLTFNQYKPSEPVKGAKILIDSVC